MPELNSDSENYPIFLLLKGRQALIDGRSPKALQYLSLAMVLTPTDKFWKAELYYWNVIANGNLDKEAAAAALKREMQLFFPEDRWTKKLSPNISENSSN